MVKITFVQPDGVRHSLDVPAGENLMKCAVNADIRGVLAECGGACACATCQVSVDPAWRDKLPTADDMEQSMLDDEEAGRRLTCQITVTEAMDGLIVTVPPHQH